MNLTLPYFEGYECFLSEYTIELLYVIEHLFNDIDYDRHGDDLTALSNSYPFTNGSERANLTLSIYREHIDIVLAMQGIFLSDPYCIKLSNLVEILKGCNQIAIHPLKELLPFEFIDTDTTPDEFFATIIETLTELSISDVLENIKSIAESTLEYLHNNIPVPHIEINQGHISRQRFLKALPLLLNENLTVNEIKKLNSFEYSPLTFALGLYDELREISNDEVLANEIILLTLGSHVSDETLEASALNVSDTLIDDLKRKIKVNGYINLGLKTIRRNSDD